MDGLFQNALFKSYFYGDRVLVWFDPKGLLVMIANDRLTVLSAMLDQAVIPVFYDPDPEVCVNVIQSCINAGARCVEFANRGDFAPHVFLEICRHFFGHEVQPLLGAGSVIDAPTAAMYIANGAKFVVGPLLNSEVARLCNRRAVAYIPGCATATEIGNAQELGCEIIKLFPGGAVGGPEFARSILAPMPWTRLMPTGDVEPNEASLREWFSAGIAVCGIGGRLISRELVRTRNFRGIEDAVAVTLGLAKKLRMELATRT